MKKTANKKYVFGDFLRKLREKKGVSLKEAEKAIGVSNAYISQLETGTRKKLPDPERIRAIANYYNVSVAELLEKAGYYEPEEIKETYEQKVEKSFAHLINNPKLSTGINIKPKDLPLDIKRFVLNMQAYCNQLTLIGRPYIEGILYEKNKLKRLKWKTDDVVRESYKTGKEEFIRYRVTVTCIEITGLPSPELYNDEPLKGSGKVTQTATAQGEFVAPLAEYLLGYETYLLNKATDNALIKALKKIKGTDWKLKFTHLWDAY
jgi:transcriptional regulator with XRE-family HTH domain